MSKQTSSTQELLSIITITYNDCAGLLRTIESLEPLLSSSLAWELIIVDSSPEKSKKVIDKLSSRFPLVYLEQEPLGQHPTAR